MQIRLGTLKQTMKINMKVREKKKEKKLALENWRKISTILSKLSSTNKKNRIHTIIQERKKREKKKDQACLYYIIYIYIQAGWLFICKYNTRGDATEMSRVIWINESSFFVFFFSFLFLFPFLFFFYFLSSCHIYYSV